MDSNIIDLLRLINSAVESGKHGTADQHRKTLDTLRAITTPPLVTFQPDVGKSILEGLEKIAEALKPEPVVKQIPYPITVSEEALEAIRKGRGWLTKEEAREIRMGASGTVGMSSSLDIADETPSVHIRFFMDGLSWCAVLHDFENLQVSPAGFGCSPVEALDALILSDRSVKDIFSKVTRGGKE